MEDSKKKGISARFIAVVALLVVVGWVMSGVLTKSPPSPEKQTSTKEEKAKVRVRTIAARPKTKLIKLFGVTEASRRVDLKAEVEGKIERIFATEGSKVKKGEVVLKIETRDRKANLAKAEAAVRQREIDFAAAQKLSAKGFQAETKLAEAEAALEAARADFIKAKIAMDNIGIKAPFDGILEKINVEEGTLVGPGIRIGQGSDQDGDTIVTVIDRNPFLVIGQVSERNVNDIRVGMQGSAELITGQNVTGKVIFISKIADPLTRTFRVELEIPNPADDIVSGVTASITIPLNEEVAHLIPPSAITLGENGELGVKIVNGEESEDRSQVNGHVKFFPLKVFDNDAEGIWAVDLPQTIHLITVGQEFVKKGDAVTGVVARDKPVS